jgi:hypothetical protein
MSEPDDDDEKRRQRANLLTLAVVAVIVLLGGWVVFAIHANLQLQKCFEEGRRDCAPVDLPAGN